MTAATTIHTLIFFKKFPQNLHPATPFHRSGSHSSRDCSSQDNTESGSIAVSSSIIIGVLKVLISFCVRYVSRAERPDLRLQDMLLSLR